MVAASYVVQIDKSEDALRDALQRLLAAPIIVEKRGKAGIRSVDIRPQVFDAKAKEKQLCLLGRLDAAGSLHVGLFMSALFPHIQESDYTVHRDCIYASDGLLMPPVPKQL